MGSAPPPGIGARVLSTRRTWAPSQTPVPAPTFRGLGLLEELRKKAQRLAGWGHGPGQEPHMDLLAGPPLCCLEIPDGWGGAGLASFRVILDQILIQGHPAASGTDHEGTSRHLRRHGGWGASVGSRGSVLTPTPRTTPTPAHQGFLDPGPTFGRLCPCPCVLVPVCVPHTGYAVWPLERPGLTE